MPNKSTGPPLFKLPKLPKTNQNLDFAVISNGTIQTLLISQLAYSPFFQERKAFWLVKDQKQAQNIFALLNFWKNWIKNPSPKILLWNQADEIIKTKIIWSIFSKEPGIIIFAISDLEEILPDPSIYQSQWIVLKKNQKINSTELIKSLVTLGYERDSFAASAFYFSQRGGIVDIFSPQFKNPFRIDLVGGIIEQIYSFDLKTKKKLVTKDQVEILPRLVSINHQQEKSFLDYLNKSVNPMIISIDPDQFSEMTFDWLRKEKGLKKYPKISFHTFSIQKEKEIKLSFQTAPLFHYDLRRLISELKEFNQKNYQIYLATNKEKELDYLFKKQSWLLAEKIKIIKNPPLPLEGFQSPLEKVVLLTDREIFGYLPFPTSGKTTSDQKFLWELKPGEYIVHLDHGIARFRGLVKKQIGEAENEYFYLEYAEGDKLFVPLYQAEKISKYIGRQNPILHRLSGTHWQEVCQQVKKDTLKLAKELLDLSAQRELTKSDVFRTETSEEKALANSFEYELTPDQEKTMREINRDLEQEKPMDRLICGDVGFGKTELAIRAAFKAVINGKQVAILSPTTILTQQHFDTFSERLKQLGVNIDLLSRFQTKKQQKETIQKLKNNLVDIVIGTHRLFSKDVQFKDLGLLIIDEEQRFGVKHKEYLKKLKTNVPVLMLSATPIPRTLHFAFAGLKDISTIETPPPGRLAIETIIEPYQKEVVKEAINLELKRDGQVYYLHNRVETINQETNKLQELLPAARIGIIHGQLPEKDLAEIMKRFDQKEIDVLVSTTIIENGLDLPNVNTLIVKDSTNFGLADLYQLRGRIGRGNRQAFAYFLYNSQKLSDDAKKRLTALLEAKELGSGFQLAIKDLEIRGSGNLLGKEQHGKINAIGLNLYLRLLEQAVLEFKTGKKPEPIRDITIDLPLEVGIPSSLEPREEKRLFWYQKLSSCSSIKELEKQVKGLTRGKEMPEIMKNLIELLKLKIIAQRSSLLSIETGKFTSSEGLKEEKIILKLSEGITPEQIDKLLKLNSNWQLGEYQLKIRKNDLGKNWLDSLKQCATIFTQRKIVSNSC